MVMRDVRDAIATILDHTTLTMVCRRVDQNVQKKRGPEAVAYDI
jgi:hypothetical protein